MNLENMLNNFKADTSESIGNSISTNIIEPLMPFLIGLSVITVLMTVLFIVSAITNYRSQRAILEMRDILKEMNDRQKPPVN